VANALTVDRRDAAEIVRAAERVSELPATAAVFAAGAASVRQVNVIGQLLESAQALGPEMRGEVEAKIAAVADESTPTELRRFGTELIQSLDTREPDPDAPPPVQINELVITPLPGGGGLINGRFEDPVRFNTILAVLDAKSAPLTADDQRSAAERQADALADVCGYVAEHGDSEVLPSTGGYRPQVYLTVGLPNLEDRADAGCLAFGGTPTPGELRRLCCDAGVIPVVMNGASQLLDIGRNQRTIPSGLRAAVTVRDGGCAHPGCDRPPPWSEIHHIKEWCNGGETKLNNLVMLCKVHHREIHSTDWLVRMGPDAIPEFIPPEWIDRSRKPRRHPRIAHRLTPQRTLAGAVAP
jgi:5-methylcytosine-specific restriction protein A